MNNDFIEFYVRKFDFVNDVQNIDVNFVQPIIRRRLSAIDKASLYVLNNTFTNDIQNIVFSSQFGEYDRLLKIIDQYSENNEVSPNVFSGSVHNYPAAFYLLNIKKPIPYSAVSSCENSISYGLLTALISDYNNVIFCYSDKTNESVNSFAVNISKNMSGNSTKYAIINKRNDKYSLSFSDFVSLFSGKISKLDTDLYSVERID